MDSHNSHKSFHSMFSPIRAAMTMLFLFLASACATAPVQEMSDARQAIQVAESAGLDEDTQENLVLAKQLLKRAKRALGEGEYKEARNNAIAAREQALRAQQYGEYRVSF
jgi:hypothetical protein